MAYEPARARDKRSSIILHNGFPTPKVLFVKFSGLRRSSGALRIARSSALNRTANYTIQIRECANRVTAKARQCFPARMDLD
jgi:hypothetical protein